jgi:hypothetical protein
MEWSLCSLLTSGVELLGSVKETAVLVIDEMWLKEKVE